MPDNTIIALAIQVPLVGLFMWFVLRQSSDARADFRVRDEGWQKFIAQQNELWRNFVSDTNIRNSMATDMVATRLVELAAIIQRMIDKFEGRDALGKSQ